jgi:hypothetical protein
MPYGRPCRYHGSIRVLSIAPSLFMDLVSVFSGSADCAASEVTTPPRMKSWLAGTQGHEQALGIRADRFAVAEHAAQDALAALLGLEVRLDAEPGVNRRDAAVINVQVGGP